jgi:hypothetical protein
MRALAVIVLPVLRRGILATGRRLLTARFPLFAKVVGVHLRAPFPIARLLAFRRVRLFAERAAAIAGRHATFAGAGALERLFRRVGALEAAV